MSNTPSNTEAWDLWLESITGGHHPASLAKFARAVLAKWGQPAQAAEPVAWVWRFSDGSFCETPFETQKACAQDAIGYEGEPAPLYLAPQPVARRPEFDQFLSDVTTAAGLVTHGKQCKQLGERLGAAVMKLRVHGIKGGQHVE